MCSVSGHSYSFLGHLCSVYVPFRVNIDLKRDRKPNKSESMNLISIKRAILMHLVARVNSQQRARKSGGPGVAARFFLNERTIRSIAVGVLFHVSQFTLVARSTQENPVRRANVAHVRFCPSFHRSFAAPVLVPNIYVHFFDLTTERLQYCFTLIYIKTTRTAHSLPFFTYFVYFTYEPTIVLASTL